MLKKLLQGFIFGVGFTAGVIFVSWGIATFQTNSLKAIKLPVPSQVQFSYEERRTWSEQPVSEKVGSMTGLALLRFNDVEDGKKEAYVEKVIFKDDSITPPLNVGDRVETSDYYPEGGNTRNRDGVLIMYIENPPKEIETTFLYDSRLFMNRMPVELFIQKFEEATENGK